MDNAKATILFRQHRFNHATVGLLLHERTIFAMGMLPSFHMTNDSQCAAMPRWSKLDQAKVCGHAAACGHAAVEQWAKAEPNYTYLSSLASARQS